MSNSEHKKSQKARRWVRKWEEHKHCSVCGLAMDANIDSDFCSHECEIKFKKWQEKQKKKDKIFTYIMVGFIIIMIIFMIVSYSIRF